MKTLLTLSLATANRFVVASVYLLGTSVLAQNAKDTNPNLLSHSATVKCAAYLEYNHPPRTNFDLTKATFRQFDETQIVPFISEKDPVTGVSLQAMTFNLGTCRDAELQFYFQSQEKLPDGQPIYSGYITYSFLMAEDEIRTQATLVHHRSQTTSYVEGTGPKVEIRMTSEDPTSVINCEFSEFNSLTH